MKYLVVGDIAGQYDALMNLIDQYPSDTHIIAVGDLIDRGPESKEVVEWFIKNANRATAIMGNHELLMLDAIKDIDSIDDSMWYYNGGRATAASYGGLTAIPTKHLEWIKGLTHYIELNLENKKILISHAFTEGDVALNSKKIDFFWSRKPPKKNKYDLQICGHNSQFGLRTYDDQGKTWAICLDDSANKKLTGLLLPDLIIKQEPYTY